MRVTIMLMLSLAGAAVAGPRNPGPGQDQVVTLFSSRALTSTPVESTVSYPVGLDTGITVDVELAGAEEGDTVTMTPTWKRPGGSALEDLETSQAITWTQGQPTTFLLTFSAPRGAAEMFLAGVTSSTNGATITASVIGSTNGIGPESSAVAGDHASSHLPGGSDALTTANVTGTGQANAEGTAASFARSDHVHLTNIVARTGSGGNLGLAHTIEHPGATLSAGVLTLPAAGAPGAHASSHLPGGADALTTANTTTTDSGASAAEGTAASFARSDHVHDLNLEARHTDNQTLGFFDIFKASSGIGFSKSGSVLSLILNAHASGHLPGGSDALTTANVTGTDAAIANAEGSAASFARSDHTHDLNIIGRHSDDQNLGFWDILKEGSGIDFSLSSGVLSIALGLHSSSHLPGGSDALATANVTSTDGGVANAEGSAASFSRSDHTHDLNLIARHSDNQSLGFWDVLKEGSGIDFSLSSGVLTAALGLHASSHNPGGSDALATANVTGTAQANAEGSAASFARSDHAHLTNLVVQTGGGQNAGLFHTVRFDSNLTVTDAGSGIAEIDGAAGGSLTGQIAGASSTSIDTLNASITGQLQAEISGATMTISGTSGDSVQEVYAEYGANATTTTQMPLTTLPTSSDGAEFMSLVITPRSIGNILHIEAVWMGAKSSATNTLVAGIFRNSESNAVAASCFSPNAADYLSQVRVEYHHVVTQAGAITFKVRAGMNGAGTTTFNGFTGTEVLGSVPSSFLRITERIPTQ